MSDYMAAKMDDQIEGSLSENERLRTVIRDLEGLLSGFLDCRREGDSGWKVAAGAAVEGNCLNRLLLDVRAYFGGDIGPRIPDVDMRINALFRSLERQARWRNKAMEFLKAVIDGNACEDEWPALREFIEQSEQRLTHSAGTP